MAGDFSRNTFNRSRHFSGVLMQQGRVLVDAEWNEQLEIQQHRDLTETRDVIGLCGTPKNEDGFNITQTPSGDDLLIGPGRYYVDGLLCELGGTTVPVTFPASGNQHVTVPYLYLDGYDLAAGQWVAISAAKNPALLYTKITGITKLTLAVDADVSAYRNAGTVTLRRALTYTTQPDYPAPKVELSSPPHSPSGGSPINLSDGDYLVYLVAWQREVNALEDPRIREVALGGPDTTERRQTIWQVRFLPVSSVNSPHISSPQISSPPELTRCCDDYPEWEKQIAPTTGMMNAQTVPPGDQKPCGLPPTAGYQRLENQLYRVEVFRGGDTRAKSTFVWSRDNASFQTTIVDIAGSNVTLTSLGKDDYFSFGDGQWVEIVYPESELSGQPRFLAQITGPPDTSGPNPIVTLSQAPPNSLKAEMSKLRLVRWDMTDSSVTTNGIPMQTGWMNIEAGIQVQFQEGSYQTGDYWEIPARTATGDIEWPPFDVPNTNPVPQPPLETKRHYCCLAHLNVSGNVWSIHDCRKKFPPLTHICADDVCYHGTCDLPGVTTVQDAIDQLCQQSDLRFHNRHLHGWGIVCGLKVTCGPDDPTKPRSHVTVSSGYAIDCDGNDVILKQDQTIDIMSMVQTLPPPAPTSPPGLTFPDGDYSLVLDPSVPGKFRVEEFVPKSFWDDVLNDTLLLDIYNDCVKGVLTFLENELTAAGSSTEPAGPGQRLTTSLTNLLAPYRNADVGGYIFLSGDSNQSVETQYQEDFILRDFYNKLRKLLQSHTYCGMFDKARPFPGTQGSTVNYPYSGLKISTLFDTDFRTRLRVDPTGARAYAIGKDGTVHVFDLNTHKLGPIVTFPDPGAIVQDVAFSADGTQLYCIANLNNQHTMFATAALSGVQVSWQQAPALIPNVVMVTLATSSKAAGKVFAIGAGKGLYQFDTQAIFTNPAINPQQTFNAFGHMSIDDTSGSLIATALSTQSAQPPTAFDEVLLFDIEKLASPSSYPLTGGQGTAEDDILVFQAGASQQEGNNLTRIAIVFKTPSVNTKQLLILDLAQFRQRATVAPIQLTETSAVKLAYNQTTSFLMLTMLNNCRVMLVDPLKLALQQNVIFPVQISPVGIVAAKTANSSSVYVLNNISKTITAYSADLLTPAKQIDLPSLLAYHSAAIDAFWDLLGGFLEYLKDCICEHLLIDCPSCDEDDKLFLGVVSIREKQVFKICNLSQRKYVKSFPTVGYWLSAIPIVPILRKLIQMGCCQALPDIFASVSAPQPSNSVVNNPGSANGSAVNSHFQAILGGVSLFHQTSFQSLMQSGVAKIMPTQQFFTDFLVGNAPTATAPAASPQILKSHEIVGASLDTATARLQSSGVNVASVVHYDPTALGQNIAGFSTAPQSVPAGEAVSLVVNDQNQVVYYTRTSPDLMALSSQVQASQQQIKQATDAVSQVTALGQQLQASVTATQQALTASQPALTAASALQTRVANLESVTAAQQSALDATKPLQAMVDSLTAQLAAQQTANTQALAARDKQIAELTTQTQTMQTQLKQLSIHLPNIPSAGGGGTPPAGGGGPKG